MTRAGWLLGAVVAAAACGGDDDAGGPPDAGAAVPDAGAGPDGTDDGRPPASADLGRDILSTALDIDLGARRATAVIELAASASTGASFEIGDLTILEVRDDQGALNFRDTGDQLDVGVPAGAAPTSITVVYEFALHDDFDGYSGDQLTFLWPYFCGNLFPCKSAPDDGVRFTLNLTGVPDGLTAVYPTGIVTDAPSYMVAFAVGDYVYEQLGTSAAGTEVGVWYLTGEAADARAGTADLAAHFDWLEQTYGPYPFGDQVASVAASWGPGAYGGMEHHPLWHVARDAMTDVETHAHEAAHGWFGNGIRIRCWEDFVLSEGLASYLAARAIEETGGAAAGQAVWDDYRDRLDFAVATGDTPAWPDTCNAIDLLVHPLWSSIPYMKGAFFMRAVEAEVGRAELDAALATFYGDTVGTAQGVQDLLDTIAVETGFDPGPLADAWLRGLGIPD